MSDWHVTIPPGPCEAFRAAGQAQVAAAVPTAEQGRANAAVAQAEQLVFLAMTGQQDTRYGAKITRKVVNGVETLTVSLRAKPVPAP